MDPQQPEDPSDRTITIRLNRETLLLLLAVGALVVVIVLALIVQLGASQTATVPAFGTAGPGTASAARTLVAVRATSTPPQPTEAVPTADTAGQDGAGQSNGIYPAPQGDQPNTAPTAGTLPRESEPGSPQATEAVPTFQPSRPTAQGTLGEGEPGGPQTSQQTQLPIFPTIAVTPGATATPDPLFAPDTPTPRPPTQAPAPTQAPPPPATAAPAPPQAAPTSVPQPTPTTPPQAKINEPASGPVKSDGGGGQPVPPSGGGGGQQGAPQVTVLRGNVRWTIAQSPVVVGRTLQVVAGASLIIDPGVEVRLTPGTAIYVDGALYALGQPGNPVRLVARERGRWDGLYGNPGSTIILENTEVRGGGNGGTVILSTAGSVVMRGARINDNGGHIRLIDSRLEMRDSEVAGNDMPYGASVDAIYNSGGFVTMTNNRIGGNRMSAGAPPVQLINAGALDTLNVDIQRNLLIGQTGPNIVLAANGPFLGNLTCNTLINGSNGLSILSSLPQVPGMNLTVRDNAIEDHTPIILPVYEKFGIGRGATSAIAQDMSNNWWEVESGPYEPDENADGRGEAVGVNINFRPWLTTRPACAPPRP
ncbi:MAG: hypothetical protein OHK0022_14440 [Roseiflexaceae bacterium]